MMARANSALASIHMRDAEVISKFTNQAVNSDSFNQRKKAVWALYTLFGVRSAWRDESELLLIYTPSEKDEANWHRAEQATAKLAAATKDLDFLLQQFPWLCALNLGAFLAILFGGLTWQTYFAKSEAEILT
jgi:hypothetical protein